MIEFIIEILTYQAEGVNQAIAPAAFLIPGAIQALGGLIGGKARRAEAKKARAEYESARADYLAMNTTNPYENMVNPYQNLEVNTQEAEFMAQQQNQQQANMLANLRAAAGGSGVAGLAQVISNQGAKTRQQIAASIGKQEAMNQRMIAKGQMQVDQLKGQGDMFVQKMEKDKTETLLGMAQSRVTASNAARQAARDQIMGGIGSMGSAMVGLASTDAGMKMLQDNNFWSGAPKTPSDRKLKKNIKLTGKSPSGINIYSFKYKNSVFGAGTYQGVMADEVPHAVVNNGSYDMVDYNLVDVDFKQI